MEIIKFNQKEKVYIPQHLVDKLNHKSFCFIDIETTGFNHMYNNIILIGLLIVHNDNICINQFFAESSKEELDLLRNFIKVANKIDYFISYNGNNFDIPFINDRCSKFGLNFNISKVQSIDILNILKNYKQFLNVDNLKLKTIEKFLKINRTDTISGKDVITLYKNYEKNNDYNLKKLILKHNYDDVYNLQFLLKIFDYIENKISFNVNISTKSQTQLLNINIQNVLNNQNYFSVKCNTDKLNLKKQIYFSENYSFIWLPIDGNLTIDFEIRKSKLSDGKECYYISQYDYPFTKHIVDTTKYKLPKGILLIQYGDIIASENLKNIIKAILKQSMKYI